MKAVALHTLVEIPRRQGEVSRNVRHCAVKDRIEAGELRDVWVNAFRSLDQAQGLRDVQRGKMDSRPKLLKHRGRDPLMDAECRSTMNNPMADGNRRCRQTRRKRVSKTPERLVLRLREVGLIQEDLPGGGPQRQAAILSPDTLRKS